MTIRELLKNIGKYGSGLATGLSIHTWVKDFKNGNEINSTVKVLVEKNAAKEEIIKELLESKIENTITQDKILSEVASSKKSFDIAQQQDELLTSIKGKLADQSLSSSDRADLEKTFHTAAHVYRKSLEEASKVYDNLQSIVQNGQSSSGKGGMDFISNSQELFNYVQSSIENLTQYQKFAFIHISASIFILFCLFTLIAVFTGQQLIDYFNLTTRFPRLAKYILLRQRFQLFYFILNSIFIIIMLLIIISLNIFAITQE